MNELDLFAAAIAITDPAERGALVERECEGRPELRTRVNQLLDAHFKSQPLLDQLAPGRAGHRGAATADFMAVEVEGAVVAGKYKLLQQIGEGGMGSVWMADQTEPVKRKVAIKLIRVERGQSKTVLARFEAERQAIALMDHPHIAKLLDAGTTEAGSPYFVMELVKGVPLTEYCDTHKLSIPDRLTLFTQICLAVQHAHQKGIIHRDLKPSNLLVESHDGKPVPKVIDFGLAKATTGLQLSDRTLFTAFGSVMGTPQYMAPEQANFNAIDVDTRADIYALGVVLYELLTGTTPLTRDTIKQAQLDEMLKLIREQEAPTPSSRLSSTDSMPSVAANRRTEPAKLGRFVKGELDWIVLKALAKERDRRYETASVFAKDIERFLDHEPVTAGPPTAAYRLRKFVRRNRPQVMAASLVLLALVAGVIGTTVGLVRAKRAAEAERSARNDVEKQKIRAEAGEELAGERLVQVEAEKQKAEHAAAQEKAANEQTQRRLGQIEKGVELFAGMLEGIDPRSEGKDGKPLYDQLRERAEKAADQLQAEAVADPLAEARLQAILGNTLRELGSFVKAIAVLEKARATRERELGADHPDTLTTLAKLALAYQEAGRTADAIALGEQVRDEFVKKLGADHPDTLATLNNLALAYRAAGRTADAMALFEQVRDAQAKKLGAEHPSSLATLNNLAEAYEAAGRTADAIALLERVRDAFVKKLGADHPSTLITLHNLALAYKTADRLPEAIAVYEQVRDAQAKQLGADHPSTLATLSNLAAAYQAAGQRTDAIALFEHVRDAHVKKLGADHPDTLTTLNNLAAVYQTAGRTAEAIALLEQVRNAQVKKLGADHPSTLTTLNNLARAYQDASRLPEAIALFEQVRDGVVKNLGADHPNTLTTLNNLAVAYKAAGRTADAIALYEQAAAAIEKRKFQHEHARRIIPNTITAYEAAGQLDKAEGWQRKWLAHVKEKTGAESPTYAGALVSLGLLLLKQAKWADAEPLLRECLTLREKAQPDAWTTFNTMSILGGALLGQKKYSEAEPLLLKGYDGMKAREKTIPKVAETRMPEAIDRLMELYTATDKPEEAKKYRDLRAKYPAPKEATPRPKP
jgi:serine/threonine protein kinase